MFLRSQTLLPGRPIFALTSVPHEQVESPDGYSDARHVKSRTIDQIIFIAFAIVAFPLPSFVESSSIINAWWTLAFAYTFASSLRHRKEALALARASVPYLLLLVIIAASSFWSDDPSTTARRAFALLGSGIISFWVALRFDLRTFINSLGITIAIVAILSLLLVLLSPGTGIMTSGEWQGIFDRKNTLGQVMLLGLITMFCSTDGSTGFRKTAQVSTIAVLGLLLLGARSATSLFIAILLSASFPLLYWSRSKLSGRPMLLVVLGLLATATIALMSTVGEDYVLNALGKDETLTTRTDVWQYVSDGIAERPTFGHGYKVFWLSHGGSVTDTSRNSVSWATQAHNGYLETILDTGYVGLASVCYFLLAGLRRSLLFFWRSRNLISAWPLLVMLSFIVLNFAEATISKYYDVEWIALSGAFLFATQSMLRRQANLRAGNRGRSTAFASESS